jgi:hypothetical protein
MQNGNIVNVRKSKANYKFYCKLIAGESGNLYVCRGVIKNNVERGMIGQ